jgi:hypothetical protein
VKYFTIILLNYNLRTRLRFARIEKLYMFYSKIIGRKMSFSMVLKGVESFLKNFWWVFLFVLLSLIFYERALQGIHSEYSQLNDKRKELQRTKSETMQQQKSLLRELNSQSDQSWIELTLMKGLGMVPEGHEKVYFKQMEAKN